MEDRGCGVESKVCNKSDSSQTGDSIQGRAIVVELCDDVLPGESRGKMVEIPADLFNVSKTVMMCIENTDASDIEAIPLTKTRESDLIKLITMCRMNRHLIHMDDEFVRNEVKKGNFTTDSEIISNNSNVGVEDLCRLYVTASYLDMSVPLHICASILSRFIVTNSTSRVKELLGINRDNISQSRVKSASEALQLGRMSLSTFQGPPQVDLQ